MKRLIALDKGVIPACDVTITRLEEIVRKTADIPKIVAYKVGFVLGLSEGLPNVV